MERSAGIIVYKGDRLFLVRAAGPFDKGTERWTVPKGLVDEQDEDDWSAAVREWEEETGDRIRNDEYYDLGEITAGNKRNHLFAVEQEAEWKCSNTFRFHFRNGRTGIYNETDAGGWFTLQEAERMLPKSLRGFIPRLRAVMKGE